MKQFIAAAIAFSFLGSPAAFAAQGVLPLKQEQKGKDKKPAATKKAAPKAQNKGTDKKNVPHK
ncbi:hypothetical protein [Ochrobactrum sp. RH2CCR150]|uniref:hypothetical protein n=1 Tax=Ochrobactrum sp. RH2CCR150 TaxID=2587044 RepID=UPI0015FB0F4F|nr:hypothetical protein [Ochrobactrum sp. RH2CCR150]